MSSRQLDMEVWSSEKRSELKQTGEKERFLEGRKEQDTELSTYSPVIHRQEPHTNKKGLSTLKQMQAPGERDREKQTFMM